VFIPECSLNGYQISQIDPITMAAQAAPKAIQPYG
jgi:hypothetical protein